MITVAIALPALLGASGLAVDLGQWYRERATLQLAADAAALGDARLLLDKDATQADYQTVALAEANGAIGSGTVGTLATPAAITIVPATSVTVTLTSTASRYFTAALLIPAPTLRATAEAGVIPPPDCVLALGNTQRAGIDISGTPDISAPTCGIFSDAPTKDSISISGSGSITAKTVGSVGTIQQSGTVTVSPAPVENAAYTPDPLANLPAPPPGPCTTDPDNISGSGSATLDPGTYCSGLSISGSGTISFNPGLYIFEKDLSISGSVTITSANGVTFYFGGGSSTATINWSGSLSAPMTAPTTGPYAGVLIYQDRSAKLGNTASISGSSGFNLGGIIYMPEAALSVSGSSSEAPPAAQGFSVIANTIDISGSPSFATGTQASAAWSNVTLLQ